MLCDNGGEGGNAAGMYAKIPALNNEKHYVDGALFALYASSVPIRRVAYAELSAAFAKLLVGAFVVQGGILHEQRFRETVLETLAVRTAGGAGVGDIAVGLGAVAPCAANQRHHIGGGAVGGAVGVNPHIDLRGAGAGFGVPAAAHGVKSDHDDAPVLLHVIEVAQGIHYRRTAVAVPQQHDIGVGIALHEGAQVALQTPCAVEKEVACAAVPRIEGAQLPPAAGEQGHRFIGGAEVREHLFAESAHKDHRHVGLFGGQKGLVTPPEKGGGGRGFNAGHGQLGTIAQQTGSGKR